MLAVCQDCPGPGDEQVTVSVLREAEITVLSSPHKDFEKERSLCAVQLSPGTPSGAGTLHCLLPQEQECHLLFNIGGRWG